MSRNIGISTVIRNNASAVAKRAVSGGLAPLESEDNTLIVCATTDGTTADRADRHQSRFTEALPNHIATPGLQVNLPFWHVRRCDQGDKQRGPQVYASGVVALVPRSVEIAEGAMKATACLPNALNDLVNTAPSPPSQSYRRRLIVQLPAPLVIDTEQHDGSLESGPLAWSFPKLPKGRAP